jgi:hypothetical protein
VVSRLDGVDSISCSFFDIAKVALLLSLPIKHLLENPFLPYDSLDSSDGVAGLTAWNYNIYRRLFIAGPRRQVAELC